MRLARLSIPAAPRGGRRRARIGVGERSNRTVMKGVIQVGSDSVRRTVASYRSRRRGNRVVVRLRPNEPAKLTYGLRGPTRRTVNRGRLGKGRHGFAVRGLARGSYRARLTAVDDFDNEAARRSSFVVR